MRGHVAWGGSGNQISRVPCRRKRGTGTTASTDTGAGEDAGTRGAVSESSRRREACNARKRPRLEVPEFDTGAEGVGAEGARCAQQEAAVGAGAGQQEWARGAGAV